MLFRSQGYNTLTQRTKEPESSAWVTIDASNIKDGDFAGITALQGCYAALAITKHLGKYELVMVGKVQDDATMVNQFGVSITETVFERREIQSPVVTVRCDVDYREGRDEAFFSYLEQGEWTPIGKPKKMVFKLDHFTGCRFGLYYYATKEIGGFADFMEIGRASCRERV